MVMQLIPRGFTNAHTSCNSEAKATMFTPANKRLLYGTHPYCGNAAALVTPLLPLSFSNTILGLKHESSILPR
jgi:hypothetical protein